jgi:hypothetical protein
MPMMRRQRLPALMRTFVQRRVPVIRQLLFTRIGCRSPASLLLRTTAKRVAPLLVAPAAPAATPWLRSPSRPLLVGTARLHRRRMRPWRRRCEGARSRGHIGRRVGIGLVHIGHRSVSVWGIPRPLKLTPAAPSQFPARCRITAAPLPPDFPHPNSRYLAGVKAACILCGPGENSKGVCLSGQKGRAVNPLASCLRRFESYRAQSILIRGRIPWQSPANRRFLTRMRCCARQCGGLLRLIPRRLSSPIFARLLKVAACGGDQQEFEAGAMGAMGNETVKAALLPRAESSSTPPI